MDEASNRKAVQRLWDRFQARDWAGASEVLADDLVVEWPHSGEVIHGPRNFLLVNEHHPAKDWSIQVRRIVAQGDQVVSEVAVPHADGVAYAASFFELRGGRIARIVEYWVDGHSQQPEAYRRDWVGAEGEER